MKIITCDKQYSYSINFVDENNVFVGYDLEQQCCEEADWFFTDNNLLGERNEYTKNYFNINYNY